MQSPEWLKRALYGAACGAIALATVGFSWGGWVTGGKAEMMADQRSRADVVTALTAICADQAKRDPLLAERVALLKTTSSYNRGDLIMKNGWATMPGTDEPNRRWRAPAPTRLASRRRAPCASKARPSPSRSRSGCGGRRGAACRRLPWSRLTRSRLRAMSYLAYRRVAAVIFLPLARGGQGSFEAVQIDPQALEAALSADNTEPAP